MSSGWSTTTSKKARRKKVAENLKKANIESGGGDNKKKKKKKKKTRNIKKIEKEEYDEEEYDIDGDHGNEYDTYYNVPRLTDKQYRISRKIADFWPNYKCNHVLPKIITKLNLNYFDPLDEKLKIQILDCIVSELQDAMSGNKGNKGNKGYNKGNKQKNDKKKNNENDNNKLKNNDNKQQKQQKQQKQKEEEKKEEKDKKFGAYFMRQIGSIFLEFIDKETMSNLIRIKSFSFLNDPKVFTLKQRLRTYTSSNDIKYRLNTFNSNCFDSMSSLKLYELKKSNKISLIQCLFIIICNGLYLDHRFKAKQQNECLVSFDVSSLSSNLSKKIIKQKCKDFNYWNITNINDLNEAYLTQFAEYQQLLQKNKNINNHNNNIDAVNVDGQFYLKQLNQFIINKRIIKTQNIKTINCAYLKIIKNYELHSFLWLFVELKTHHLKNKNNKKDIKQFMVWNGQCGRKQITNTNKY